MLDTYSVLHTAFPTRKTDIVIVEDSNSGYDFFKNVVGENVTCVSAEGKEEGQSKKADLYLFRFVTFGEMKKKIVT